MSLPQLRERAAVDGLPFRTVAAEALHVILLDALFAVPGSERMVFQGGTCLHLVHGGYRYSEDLDLAGAHLDAETANGIIARVRSEAEKLSTEVLGTGTAEWKARAPKGRLCTFWFLFLPDATRDKIRVKIDLARFPTYRPEVLPVVSDLDLLNRRPLVRALSPPELLAEKVTAVLGRPHLKGRDLFDLWYLDLVLRATLDGQLLQRKIEDYGVTVGPERLRDRLAAIAAADLAAEMHRFLPVRQRTLLEENGYEPIRLAAQRVLERVSQTLDLE